MSSQGQYIRLETTGRKTGKPHHVLLRFVTAEGRIVVFPENNSAQDWVLNLKSDPKVRVHNEGRVIQGVASLRHVKGLGDPLLSVFSRKYGDEVVRTTYWGQLSYVEIRPVGEAPTEDYSELVYADLEAAFDGVAEDYDRHIFGNSMNVWLRNMSLKVMNDIFHPGEIVLEIGCGTGAETLSLAERGVNVVACDISSKMLEVLRSKSKKLGLAHRITLLHCRPYELKEKVNELGIESVDGAYSTYGAINTDPRLDDFLSNLHALLKSNAHLLLGVWNKYCLYEILGYAFRGKLSMSVARLTNPVPLGKSRFCVTTTSYSVGSLNKAVARYFKLKRVHGVCVLLPPSNLTKYLPGEPGLGWLKKIDVVFGGAFPLNRLGDHFLAVYSKIDGHDG